MTNIMGWKWLVLVPAVFSATLWGHSSATAEPSAESEIAIAAPTEIAEITEIAATETVQPAAVLADATPTFNTAQPLAPQPAQVELPAVSPVPVVTVQGMPQAIPQEMPQTRAEAPAPAPSATGATSTYSITSAGQTRSFQSSNMTRLTSVDQLSQTGAASQQGAMDQLTSITQLTDVQPTDWAYQALQSLVERYGCIVGYPDSTYRGQRALTRFEFAAGMNACLDRISELLAASTADLATKEDLATLQRLQEEFAAELAALRGRVDVLEARTAALEANQFSTTTKLSGETLFYVADIFNEEAGFDNETVFQYRSRLIFDTSFSGTDQLRARIQAGTLEPFNQPGNELGFGAFGNTDGRFFMDLLSYQFPVSDVARINIFANGGGLDDATFGNTINPLDNPARSAITRFGQRNAIYRTASTSAGAAINFFLTDNISLQAAYLAGENSDPSPGSGLFNGNYGALGQLTFRNIFDVVDLAFTYVNAYTGTSINADGSITAGVPFGLGSRASRVDIDRPVIANSYGIEANLKLFPGFQLGGWVGYSAIRAIGVGDASVWNYAGTLAFPDLFSRGSLGGIIFGMQPRLTGSDAAIGNRLGQRKDPDVGFHLEAFYRYAVNDNIDITPGLIWITAPNHNDDNNDEFMGVLRTTFRF